MKIYKLSGPLPLETVPVAYGEGQVDSILTDQIIEELQTRFNITEHLGGGMWGAAFLTGDGKVLKLTTDAREIEAAKTIQTIPHGPFAEIYEVGQVEGVDFILKEKIMTLTEEEEWQANEFFCLDFNNDEEINMLEEQIEQPFFEMLSDYMNDVVNYPFEDTLRGENIGKDQYGNLVSFDPRQSTFGP